MPAILRLVSCIAALVATFSHHAVVVPYLAPRPQGADGVLENVGFLSYVNKFSMSDFYGGFMVTPCYEHTAQSYKIAQYLWCDAIARDNDYTVGRSCPHKVLPTIKVYGTKVADRPSNALCAENFYLPTDFASHVTFDPSVRTATIDCNGYLGLDRWYPGLYVRIHAPLCSSRWRLGFRESVANAGVQPYDVGYFNDTFEGDSHSPDVYGINRSKLLASFADYIVCGSRLENSAYVTYEPLRYARICPSATKTCIADISAAAGLNFWMTDDYHAGLNFRVTIPTGNRPCADMLFEPIVGNGHHWELGLGATAHWCLARKRDDDDIRVGLYIDTYCTHVFRSFERRTFDVCNKPLSRYMLATLLAPESNNLNAGDDHVPVAAQGARVFAPVANITTLPVEVSAQAHGECTATLVYNHHDFELDIGYNFWGRSCQKIVPRYDRDTPLTRGLWGLKGTSFSFGFPASSTQPGNFSVDSRGIALSATQSEATIFSGADDWPSITWNQNNGVDNPLDAYDDSNRHLYTHAVGSDTPQQTFGWLEVKTSNPPAVLTPGDLDIPRASSLALAQKFFVYMSYTFSRCTDHEPYLGLGMSFELGQEDESFNCMECAESGCSRGAGGPSCSTSCCNPPGVACAPCECTRCALSYVQIFLKGGIAFG